MKPSCFLNKTPKNRSFIFENLRFKRVYSTTHPIAVTLLGIASILIILAVTGSLFVSCKTPVQKEEWVPLFNGQNLDGWEVKIRGHELNDNHRNTFRVKDGVLKVSYEDYDEFGERFGHIFFLEQKFSHFKLRVEYRFVGNQIEGAADWAFRNSGIMFHSQSAASMKLDQSFPVSIEAQMLGGDGINERPNGNVCTPGTTVEIDGVRILEHCINSRSRTFHGDDWVLFELVVFGDSIAHHIIEGDTVLTYKNFQLEEGGLPLSKGYIALQAESHPIEFRKIELLNLKP